MKDRRQVWGWIMYDWANSAFATTVMGVFFPVFFKQYWCTGIDVTRSTLLLGLTNSIATLIVVISAPILGAIADQGSSKKAFLTGFAYLGVAMTSLLFLLGEGSWMAASVIFGLGIVGFSAANVFYDALLPSIAGEEKIDFVSGLGFGFGYLGGGLLLALNALMAQKPAWFGLANGTEGVQFSFLTVAIWWGLFSLPLVRWVREEKRNSASPKDVLLLGFRKVFQTFRKVRQMPMTFMFLAAYWLYIDGVDTIVRMAADFGLSIGFGSGDIILAFLITQFVGFPCALGFGKLGEIWDAKKLILIAIGVYILVTLYGMFMTKTSEFYMLAITIGLVQGGVQALSRSFYSRLIPSNQEAEFFGFYNMLGKFAAIIGPVLMGTMGVMVRGLGYSQDTASRSGIGSIVILFVLGGILLYKVDEDRGHRDALAA
jgi:UMF1 family MFS transporter